MTRDERVAQWELLFEIEEGLPPFIAECVEQVVARETQRLSNPRQTSSPVWRPFPFSGGIAPEFLNNWKPR
jgi:hypothetical protein